jgi:hypothetical protein
MYRADGRAAMDLGKLTGEVAWQYGPSGGRFAGRGTSIRA